MTSSTTTCVFALLSLVMLGCSGAETPVAAAGGEQTKNQDAGGEGEGRKTPGDEKPPAPEEPPNDFFGLWPKTIHTGFAPGGTYKVPVSVRYFDPSDGKEPAANDWSWEVADAAIATIIGIESKNEERPGEVFALVTVKKAGSTKVIAKGKNKQFEASLDVIAYTDEQLTTGRTRYKDGGTGQRQPCAGCHELANGVDHSPTWLAFYADADVLAAVTTGKYADGRVLKGVNHKWELTEAEKTGILAYLRSIPPKGF